MSMSRFDPKKSALVVFAREPKEGKVKTRFLRELSPQTVTRIYEAFIRDVLKVARQANCDQRFLYYAGAGSSIPFLRRFEKKFLLKRQVGEDLGVRMHRAFSYCQRRRFDKTVIIGTDCLTLTAHDIETALRKLSRYDCVLGPSKDGGYYLIGLKDADKRIFENIKWGTSSVLKATLKRIQKLNKKTYLLREREDMDTAEQLRKFPKNVKAAKTSPYTQKALRNLSLPF